MPRVAKTSQRLTRGTQQRTVNQPRIQNPNIQTDSIMYHEEDPLVTRYKQKQYEQHKKEEQKKYERINSKSKIPSNTITPHFLLMSKFLFVTILLLFWDKTVHLADGESFLDRVANTQVYFTLPVTFIIVILYAIGYYMYHRINFFKSAFFLVTLTLGVGMTTALEFGIVILAQI